jgi:hypothetical protein
MLHMTNQVKLRSFRMTTKYMHGMEIPKNYRDALRLDKVNGDTKWHDCTFLEMGQLTDYRTGGTNTPRTDYRTGGTNTPRIQRYQGSPCIRH